MSTEASGHEEALLAEQINYYRSVAEEYFDHALDAPGGDELVSAVEEFGPRGDVLELACGPGTWTPQLLRHAMTVTAVDASPEMQVLGAAAGGRGPSSGSVRRCRLVLVASRPPL